MDVIGNNIANVNTYGFKRNRASFQDVFYQQLQGASRPTDTVGGTNPKEVGIGMTIASIDTLHLQGSYQTTNVGTDLAINGEGFFVLNDRGSNLYTRAGAFKLDKDGTLVNASGMQVQGWMAQDLDGVQVLDTSAALQNLTIPVGAKDEAKATTMVNFASNLDKRMNEIGEGATAAEIASGTWTTEEKIYDSFGEAHILRVEFSRVNGVNNSWNVRVQVNPQGDIPTNASTGLGDLPPAVGGPDTFTINFDNYGRIQSAVDAAGNLSGGEGAVTMNVAYDVQSATPEADGGMVRHSFQLNLGTAGSVLNSITQYADRSSTKIIEQDGHNMGYMDNFTIANDGTITGSFTNGTSRILGQLAMASFTNQGGLEKAGDNNFRQTINSGNANIGESGLAGRGFMRAGALEMSNVDMAEQFTDMIVTQRGFQANSRTIQTADQLLQEILNLK